MTWFAILILVLIVLKLLVQLALEQLNQRNVLSHGQNVPEPFKNIIDEPTYRRSVEYTLAKGRLRQLELTYNTIVLLVVLFSGVLAWSFGVFRQAFGESAWSMAAFLLLVGVALALPGLPLDWYDQFRLEERFGFNTTTAKLWWLDRAKGLVLSVLLGYPLLLLILTLARWSGAAWWAWTWAALLAFQLLMAVLAPVIILPLFNKFTPLPEGDLRDRLLALAGRTQFRAQSVQVMDGSKRSRHSNGTR